MKRLLFTLLGLICLLPVAWSQTPSKGRVSGSAKNAAGQPIEFTAVMLVKATDSSLVKGSLTNEAGVYQFENVPAQTYHIAISGTGYRKALSAPFTLDSLRREVQVPELVLQESDNQLQEVTVVGQKPFVEQQVDRTVLNVENSIVASGNTLLEVLEKAPGVTVDRQTDQISLQGKQGVTVMLDGKLTYLSEQELANFLRSTPSDNVEKIEIITNPSSKYDAAGNSGIINIRMKRNKNLGTNGSATIGGGYGRYEKFNGNLRLNHRQEKYNLFGNYGANYRRSFNETDIYRSIAFEDQVTYFDQNAVNPNQSVSQNYRVGLDYFANERSTLGVLVTGFNNRWQQPNGLSQAVLRDQTGQVTLRPTTTVSVEDELANLTGNLNYKYAFNKEGHELTADLDYSQYRGEGTNFLHTEYRTAAGELAQPTEELRNRQPSRIGIWAFKSDYTLPLANGRKWEFGVKSSLVQTDNNLVFEVNGEPGWQLDTTRSNQFKYNENINAVYANFATPLGKKTNVQLGLRAEQTISEGNSVTLNQVLKRRYLNLFPTFFVSRQLDSSHSLNLSYSRRIDRPSYENLNPFVFYLDPYAYQVGNPNLRPQYTHSLQLTHVYKGALSTTLGYSRQTDVIQDAVPGQNAETNVTYVTTLNLATQDNANLTVSLPIPIRNWWTVQTNLTALYSRINTNYLGAQYSPEVFTWNAYLSSNFILPKGLSAELSGWYNSAGVYGFFKSQPMGAFSVGLQKSVLKNKGKLRLNVNDPLWLNKFRGETKYQGLDARIVSRWESRVARLTFTYNFGNQNVKAARQRSTGTEEERERAGTGNN